MKKERSLRNKSDLSEIHRSTIVKILQRKEICSRAEIAKITGLTQAAITKLVAALIDEGIVLEEGIIQGSGNRRAIGLRLNAEAKRVIGVKFARHVFEVGVFDISGKFYCSKATEFALDEDTGKVIAAMKRRIYELLEKDGHVVAIGFALPGPYLREEGRIAMVTRMPVWHNINFIDEFREEFDKPVFIEQDANAGALAEYWFGDHDATGRSLAYLLVGDGVGAGIVEKGNLLLGRQGAAGELGHISIDVNGPRCECGNYGCLELYCSAPVMIKIAKERMPKLISDGIPHRTDECGIIFEAARKGNQKALALTKEIAEYVGYGCVSLINGYNPDIIVIGDRISQGRELILPTVMQVVKDRCIKELYENTEIKISGLKADSVLYGAAAIATDRVLSNPSVYLTTN